MAVFQSVQYIDPFAPLPIGSTQAGVQATINASGVPAGSVAYAQLLANLTPIGYGTGAGATAVRVLNTVPLSTGQSYLLQVQFAAAGKNPADLDWSNPANLIGSPVVVQQPRLIAASLASSSITVSWEGAGTATVAGAFVQLVDLTANQTTASYYLGVAASATMPATFDPTHQYGLRISGVQPVSGNTTGTFTAPYSVGPPSAPQPIPTSAPSPSAASCAGQGLAARWTALTPVANSAQPRYELLLLDGGRVTAAIPAGDSGGQLDDATLSYLTSPQVAARVSYGSFVGPTGPVLALYPLAPQILGVTVTGAGPATITAQLASAGALPTGGSLLATLYANGVSVGTQTLNAGSGSVSWTGVSVAAGTSYAIDVATLVTAGGQQSKGAPSARVDVPVSAPASMSASYDGQLVSINLSLAVEAGVDGYQVALAGSGGGSLNVQAGSQLPISFNANLDLGQTWTATVTPRLGLVTTRPAGSAVSLPVVTPPALSTVSYDGRQLLLQWSAAGLPYLTGYRVVVAGGPTLTTGAQQTSCVLPLTPAQAASASVTVTGLSSLRATPASAAVSVLASVIEVSSVQVGATVVASWTATPTPPTVQASLLIGDSVVSTVSGATASGVSFTAPTPASQPYRLQARAVSADGISVGPPCAPVELILASPTLESGYLNSNGRLSLRWNPVNSFGVTGYQLRATPTTGQPASLLVTGDGYDGPAPAAFSQPGTLSVVPASARCTGPAASATISQPGSIKTASYANSVLTVTADLAGAGANDTSWIEVLVNGAVVAQQPIAGAGQPSYQLPVALPPDAAASVRVSVLGPTLLAPTSAPASIPTVAPVLRSAAYDGSALQLSWLPTGQSGVTGYLVTVAGGSIEPVYVAGAGTSTATVPVSLTYPFSNTVSVSVAAVAGAPSGSTSAVGPASAGRAPSLAGYSYSSAVGATGNPPYLYRRGDYQALAQITGKPIVIYLAKPFTTADNPTVPASGSPIFQLAPAPAGSTLPYQLTLGDQVWSDFGTSPVRSSLRDSYVQFLSDVETAGAYAWAISLLRQLISSAMPQTFEEVLYYRYGYWRSDSMRIVDLLPGTRLQLSNALYQAAVGSPSEKNGFLALGNETMDVVDAIPQGGAGTLPAGAGRILSLDAFLSLAYPGGGAGSAGHPIAAGPIDFFDSQNRQSYYRLFYPAEFPASGSNGSTALTSNITLVGTTSWATLATITDQYASTGTFPSGIDYFTTYFRGRAGITPLINVTVQGETRWTAVGTSVRQALSSVGLAPYYGGDGGDALTLLRATSNLYSYPSPGGGLSLDPVELTNTGLGELTPLYWPLDMPLVGGDQVGLSQPVLARQPSA